MNFFENQWVEVFHAGEQTDSAGNKRSWTGDDLNEIVENYNATKHEAPVVIGHPKDNAPAFGWVEALKTDGRVLFARFKQLVPEFVEAVKNGLYKKRSISLYPDMTLRHVGFLGAVPPAVKGLADIRFSEHNSITIEFAQEGAKKGDFKEMKTDKDQEIQQLKEQLAKEQAKNLRAEFKEFVGRLHAEGRIISAQQEAIIDLMEAVHGIGEFEFSEGKGDALAKFKAYLEQQPQMVHFGEVVQGENVAQISASEHLALLAEQMAKQEGISYSEALNRVQAGNSDLAYKAAMEL